MTTAVISARLLSSELAKPGAKPFELSDSRLPGFTLRVQPSGSRTYYARLGRSARVKLGRVGTITPDQARERCEKVLGNVAHGRPALQGIAELGPAVAGQTLRQFIDDVWLKWAAAKRPKSWKKTYSAVRCHFSDWFDLPVAAITTQMIEDRMTERLGAGGKPSSVRRDTDALAGILTRAVKRELITVSPMKKVEKPKLDSNPKVRYLSLDEERRLRSALAARDAKMIAARDNANKSRGYKNRPKLPALPHFGDHLTVAVLLSMLTGMRRSELLRLRWRDITDVITVELTKGVDTRHQPIVPEAKKIIRKWREQSKPKSEDDYVLPVRDNLKKAWGALMKQAKIVKFTWRDLRHAYASAILQEGGNLNHVRELLGHKEMRTTLRYAQLRQDDKASAAALLSNRLKKVARRVG